MAVHLDNDLRLGRCRDIGWLAKYGEIAANLRHSEPSSIDTHLDPNAG